MPSSCMTASGPSSKLLSEANNIHFEVTAICFDRAVTSLACKAKIWLDIEPFSEHDGLKFRAGIVPIDIGILEKEKHHAFS